MKYEQLRELTTEVDNDLYRIIALTHAINRRLSEHAHEYDGASIQVAGPYARLTEAIRDIARTMTDRTGEDNPGYGLEQIAEDIRALNKED